MKKVRQLGFCIALSLMSPVALSDVDTFEQETQMLTWAQMGDSQAQNLLGHWYADERLGPVNYEEAFYWLEQAADQDHLGAITQLGLMYLLGRGTEVNDDVALSYLRRAAQEGHAAAQMLLGYMYSQGRGVEKNVEDAFAWYSLAAEAGSASAQFRLGLMYQQGIGVASNAAQANYWFAEAMRQEHPGAQFYLGLNHLYGRGIDRDRVAGYRFILKASMRIGSENRSTVDLVEDSLTPETIADLNSFTRYS